MQQLTDSFPISDGMFKDFFGDDEAVDRDNYNTDGDDDEHFNYEEFEDDEDDDEDYRDHHEPKTSPFDPLQVFLGDAAALLTLAQNMKVVGCAN